MLRTSVRVMEKVERDHKWVDACGSHLVGWKRDQRHKANSIDGDIWCL